MPVHNEEQNIPLLFAELSAIFTLNPIYRFDVVFVNDGSTDRSQTVLEDLAEHHKNVRVIEFSRNFGKEAATSAGLHASKSDAVIIMDSDLQHPTILIPEFIKKWEDGADVVIGLRKKNKGAGIVKTYGSHLYYWFMNRIGDTPIVEGATDFRLLDKKVVVEFNKFTEHDRMTRGLIAWLGFHRVFVEFEADKRRNGDASYSFGKLVHLALSSFISHSLFPLKASGYLGFFITIVSFFVGLFVFTNRYIFNDPLNLHVSGSAQLAILMVFFIGIVLMSLGVIALYIANIQNEVLNRPLYIVRSEVGTKNPRTSHKNVFGVAAGDMRSNVPA